MDIKIPFFVTPPMSVLQQINKPFEKILVAYAQRIFNNK